RSPSSSRPRAVGSGRRTQREAPTLPAWSPRWRGLATEETADPLNLDLEGPAVRRAQLAGRPHTDLDPPATIAAVPHAAHDPIDQEHRDTHDPFPLTALVRPDSGLRRLVDDRVTRKRADDVTVVLGEETHLRGAPLRCVPRARQHPGLAPLDRDRGRLGLERSQMREQGRGFHPEPPCHPVERGRPVRPEKAEKELALGFLRIEARPFGNPTVRAIEGHVRANGWTESHLAHVHERGQQLAPTGADL